MSDSNNKQTNFQKIKKRTREGLGFLTSLYMLISAIYVSHKIIEKVRTDNKQVLLIDNGESTKWYEKTTYNWGLPDFLEGIVSQEELNKSKTVYKPISPEFYSENIYMSIEDKVTLIDTNKNEIPDLLFASDNKIKYIQNEQLNYTKWSVIDTVK